MWIRVFLDEALHLEVRRRALERHLTWREVVSEAVKLWLRNQTKAA
jgi:hypothetical protein